MSLDKVIESILETGKAEARQIIENGEKERARQIKEMQDGGQRLIRSKTEETEKLIERMKVQEMARAELESKKIVLVSQKEVLDQVLLTAMERLGDLPGNHDILRALISANREELASGRAYCNKKDESFLRGLLGTSFAGTIECIGGLVIESRDGKRRVDLRYETMLRDIWDDSIKDVSEILWGEK